MEENYDYSSVQGLFDFDYGEAPGQFEQAAIGNATDAGGAFADLNGLSDGDWATLAQYFKQNPDALSGEPSLWDQVKDGAGGLVNGVINGWNALGNNGQLILGSAALGGLQNYMQQRQKDEEFQRMGQMSEEQWQRQMLLRQSPTNKVANVDHFKGIVNSLRGGR